MQGTVKKAGTITILTFGLSQLIRLGSNLITAKLLAPDLFGIMAIVSVFIQGIAMCSDLGLNVYIIRNKDYRNKHLQNVVWTIQVIRGWIIFGVILLGALLLYGWQSISEQTDSVYSNEQLPIILAIVGFTAVFAGSRTLAQSILSRELKTGRLALIDLFAQLLGTVVMITWAVMSPSIWALVSSTLVTSFTILVLNYAVFDFRHKLTWDKAIMNDVFHFGKWIFIATTMTFFAQHGDKLYLSTILTASMMGVYSIAFMLSGLTSALVEQFTSKVWLPVFSSKSASKTQLKEIFYRVKIKQDILVAIYALSLGFIAPMAIDLMYDDRYQDATWMLQIFLIGSIGISSLSLNKALLVALGETKVQMAVMVIKVIALISLLPILSSLYGVHGAISAVVISSYVGIPVQYYFMGKLGVFDLKKELRIVPFLLVILYSYTLHGII